MRLEDHEEPSCITQMLHVLFCCREGRLDLSRMMSIVIIDLHASCLALELKPSLDAAERTERLFDRCRVHLQFQGNADAGQTVQHIMQAWHGQRERARVSMINGHIKGR